MAVEFDTVTVNVLTALIPSTTASVPDCPMIKNLWLVAISAKFAKNSMVNEPVPNANAALLGIVKVSVVETLNLPLHPAGLNGLKLPCATLPFLVTVSAFVLESTKMLFVDAFAPVAFNKSARLFK